MDVEKNKCPPRPLPLLCKMRLLACRDAAEHVQVADDLDKLRKDVLDLDEELRSERSQGRPRQPSCTSS